MLRALCSYMSNQYIKQLEDSLLLRGWNILRKEEGIDWQISGIWEIQRSTKVAPLKIIFDGTELMGQDIITPMVSCHGCFIESCKDLYLDFSDLHNWRPKLKEFISSLDSL